MKTLSLLAAAVVALVGSTGLAQNAIVFTPGDGKPDQLTKFDLDFPGGTPAEFVAAIQKATSKPLNVIIPDEYTNQKLPALKMRHVDVNQLFQALQQASQKTVMAATGNYYGGGAGGYTSYQTYHTGYGFTAKSSVLSDDTIWNFFVDKPAFPPGSSPSSPRVCRFYALGPYLERMISVDEAAAGGGPSPKTMRHLTVDDITTAIETGWKMMGEVAMPTINFHKDTKLLIAVGEPAALETIDAVLKALDVTKTAAPIPAPPQPVAPLAPPPVRPVRPPTALTPEQEKVGDALTQEKARDAFTRRYGLKYPPATTNVPRPPEAAPAPSPAPEAPAAPQP